MQNIDDYGIPLRRGNNRGCWCLNVHYSEMCLLWKARGGGHFEVLRRSEEGPPHLTWWYKDFREATVARAKGSRNQDAGPRPSAKRAKQTIGAVPRSGQGCD